MWTWLASLIGGPGINGLINGYKAKLEAANTQDRIAADLAAKEIEAEIEARKLPLELAVLPVIESAFEPYAYSRAQASGLWQFIPSTGRSFRLDQNWWLDARRDGWRPGRAGKASLGVGFENPPDDSCGFVRLRLRGSRKCR